MSWLIFALALLGTRGRVRRAVRQFQSAQKKEKPERARDYVARIDGRKKENWMIRSTREARQVYAEIGQQDRYRRTLRLSLATGGAGLLAGLALRNLPLAAVLAVGLYFVPLWASRFARYRYAQFVTDELEMALSLVTTSYTRSASLLDAVKENLNHMDEPVRGVFASSAAAVQYVDPNIKAQIQRMSGMLDNKLWRQWCDTLILCQDDHLMIPALTGIVSRFADLKAQQAENATRMALPLRRAISMIAVTLSVIPLMAVSSESWWGSLSATPLGQLAMTITAIVVLMTIDRAIRLSEPVEFDV